MCYKMSGVLKAGYLMLGALHDTVKIPVNGYTILVCVSVFWPSGVLLTKDGVLKSAGNLSFLQVLRS